MSPSSIWKQYRLGDLADYHNGKAFKPSDWSDQGFPIVRIQNLTDFEKPFNYFNGDIEDRYLIDDGDLLVSWSATLGSFIWNRGPAVLNQHIFKVVPNNNLVDKEFLHYLILNTLDDISKHAHGLAMKHITKKKFERIEVYIPELNEQSRIAALIKKCMEWVDEIEVLKSLTEQEYQSLIPAALEDIFHKNEFQEIPLFDLLREKPKNGIYLPKSDYVEKRGIPIIRMGEMFRRFEVDEQVEKAVRADTKLQNDYGLLEGDILVARRSIVYEGSGSMAMVTKPNQGSIFESSIIRLRVDTSKILPQFLVAFFHSREGFFKRMGITKKATISGINQEGLKRLFVPCPTVQQQAYLLKRVDQVRTTCGELQQLIHQTEITALRESILRKAFAGEL